MKIYDLKGRKVYIQPTIKTPYFHGYTKYGTPYRSKPYRVRYVEDDSLAINGEFCSVATAKESINFYNKGI